MRKTAIGIVAAVATIGTPVFAADMPLKAPPPSPAPTWTGFYIGGNVGYTWNNDSVGLGTAPTFLNPSLTPMGLTNPLLTSAAATGSFGTSGRGFIGGGQTGYNWQTASWVFGLETDIQGLSSKGSSTVTFVQPRLTSGDTQVTTIAASQNLQYLGTLRGRLGVLVAPSFLAYATGGLAYGGASSSNGIATSEQPNTGTQNASTLGSSSTTLVGWTAGGGAEWLFAPNWSAKLEYLYYNLGSLNYGETLTALEIGGALQYTLATTAAAHFNGNIVRVGLNYKLN